MCQKGDMRLVRFIKPASERGLSLLSKDSTTNYVYLPAYKRVRRVASHARNQTFLGTDFTQADMTLVRFSDEYVPELIGETDEYYLLELTPKPGSDVNYGKLQTKVEKENFNTIEIAFFEKGGVKLKVEERMKWKFLDGKYWNATEIRITSMKDSHQTVLRNHKIEFDKGIPDEFFSTRNLKKGMDAR
jgi:outer membrane lipoprotein-sorting protein